MNLSQLPIDRQSFWPNDSLHADVFVLDVRTPAEFIEVHIPGSINVPLADLGGRAAEIAEQAGSRSIAILCRTGRRAETARKNLTNQGLKGGGVMQGGIVNWQSKGLPVNRGPKAFTIDRQVRIAAGFLVLLGVVLGTTVHQGFLGLSGFVGAGLMFAGVTDTCGMGIALGMLPWNRAGAACEVS